MHIEHIAMYVNDLEKAKDFFIKYFHATANDCYHNPKTNFKSYFLTFQQGPRLELMNLASITPSQKQIHQMGYIHIAFQLGSKKDVDELSKQLEKDGYPILSGPRTTGDGYYESCIICE